MAKLDETEGGRTRTDYRAAYYRVAQERDDLCVQVEELRAALKSVHRLLSRLGATGDAHISDAQDTAGNALAKAARP